MDNYVYIYLDPRFPDSAYGSLPFYVGRGRGARSNHHLKEAAKYKGVSLEEARKKRLNMLKINKINSIINDGFTPHIVKVAEGLTLDESKNLEKHLIQILGRSFLGEGPLTNLTEGGEGRVVCHSGPFNPFFGKTVSDENKLKLSNIHKGKSISLEQRQKISLALSGKQKSHVAKEAMKTSMRKRFLENPTQEMFTVLGKSRAKKWEVQDPSGTLHEIESLRAWCQSQGLNHKTLISAFKKNLTVSRGPSAGWKIIRLVE